MFVLALVQREANISSGVRGHLRCRFNLGVTELICRLGVYVCILTILKFQSILELFSTAHKLDRLFHPNRFPTDYSLSLCLSLFVNFVDAP